MALKATLIATGETITLDNGDQTTFELLEELRGNCPKGVIECREHDGLPHLAHRQDDQGRVHEAWLYVRQPSEGVLLLCHNPQNDPELKARDCQLRVGMSDQHRFERDSYCDIGDHVGFAMTPEYPIRGERGTVVARLDVHGKAAEREFGIEVQLSQMQAATAKSRDTKALKAGVPLVWTTRRADAPWAAGNPLAHVATNNLDRTTPVDRWRIVSGLRSFTLRPCREFQTCPDTGTPRDCGGWHPLWTADVREGDMRVADFLEQYGDGRIVRLDTRTKQGVVPVDARRAQYWHELYPPQVPMQRTRVTDDIKSTSRPCGYGRVDELPLPVREQGVAVKRRDQRTECEGCGELSACAEGLCLRCRSARAQAREWGQRELHPREIARESDERTTPDLTLVGSPGDDSTCPSCHRRSTDPHGPLHATCPEPDPDPLLALAGVMRTPWWLHCPGCGAVIHGPGSPDVPCPCGTRHARGDVVGLRDLPGGGRGWVCGRCLIAADDDTGAAT